MVKLSPICAATNRDFDIVNYRHAYHAGNFGDVLKHVALICVLQRMQKKETPLALIDTHAGIGLYNLQADEAAKTSEFRLGVQRVITAKSPPAELSPYIDLIAKFNSVRESGDMTHYPGSPEIMRLLRRPSDRLILNELHPKDYETLRRRYGEEPETSIYQMDAYKFLASQLPPLERRGLILIDPAFEEPDEFARLLSAFLQAYRRFATGCYLLWYPIKSELEIKTFHQGLIDCGIKKIMVAEILVRPLSGTDRLCGAGLILVNPPWQLDHDLERILPWLSVTVAQDSGSSFECHWLVAE